MTDDLSAELREVQDLLIKRGVKPFAVKHYLRCSAIPLSAFAALSLVRQAAITKKIEPGRAIFNVVYPFPRFEDGEMIEMTGPKFIEVNKNAIIYLKKPKNYAFRNK